MAYAIIFKIDDGDLKKYLEKSLWSEINNDLASHQLPPLLYRNEFAGVPFYNTIDNAIESNSENINKTKGPLWFLLLENEDAASIIQLHYNFHIAASFEVDEVLWNKITRLHDAIDAHDKGFNIFCGWHSYTPSNDSFQNWCEHITDAFTLNEKDDIPALSDALHRFAKFFQTNHSDIAEHFGKTRLRLQRKFRNELKKQFNAIKEAA